MPKVRVSDSAHKEIDLLRGNKTQKDFIDMLINRYKQYDTLKKKLHEKDVEIETLKNAEIPTKEQFLKSIQENNPPYVQDIPLTQLELSKPCNYHSVDEKGYWYCDMKKVPKAACIQRQRRHLAKNRMCRPEYLKKKQKPRKTDQYFGSGPIFRGEA